MSGVEIGSAAMYALAKCWFRSICLLNKDVLAVAIRRLYMSMFIQRCLAGDNQASGISMRDARKIFNIVRG